MNDRDAAKASRERNIFASFCEAAGFVIDAGSLVSNGPPVPDVKCHFGGRKHFAELVEIADQGIAVMWDKTFKTGKSVATSYSSIAPLEKAFSDKPANEYQAGDDPLHLLAYYEKQYPLTPFGPNFIQEQVRAISRKMISSGRWHSLWVYDHWNRKVLWRLLH